MCADEAGTNHYNGSSFSFILLVPVPVLAFNLAMEYP